MDDVIRRLTSRRALLTGAAAMLAAACTSGTRREDAEIRTYPADDRVTDEYRQEEISGAIEGFFGVTTQAAAEMVEKIFGDLGRPNGYMAGEEVAAAVVGGLRYGSGWLYRRNRDAREIYWTGPSVGFDLGANLSKCFTLIYDLEDERDLYQRYPGVDGSFYFVAGMGVNYLRAGNVTLAPIRTGVGARAGVNVGYLNITREREWVPL